MKSIATLLLAAAMCLGAGFLNPGQAAEITAKLHCVLPTIPNGPMLVSFGMPFPKGFIKDANLIRVKDAAGTEIPALVRTLVPWRNLAKGTNFSSIRAVLIQVNVDFGSKRSIILKVETGTTRTKDLAAEQPVRSNWVLVSDAKYPGKYQVYEPPVYVSLSPAWLGRCAVKSRVLPYFNDPGFAWYDGPLTNKDPNLNFGQNFFKTAINADPQVTPAERIWYLRKNPYLPPGEDDGSPYEPWLYDRSMTMFTIYLRSGDYRVLREAHRAAYFYASKLNSNGFFTLKPLEEGGDVKYSYNECLFTDLMLLGDEGHLEAIRNVTKAAASFNYVYKGDQGYERLWTERHLAFSWLAFIVAFEATGNAGYARQARLRANYIFHHQNNPPANADHGQAPDDGALMHGFDSHEGYWEGGPFWIFSPWQTVLLVDVMQRYYQHSRDTRVWAAAQRFGEAVINVADGLRSSTDWPGYEFPELTIPAYLAGSQGNVLEWEDYEHCLDVAKIPAFAFYCSCLAGAPQEKFRTEAQKLLETAEQVTAYWIRPTAHEAGKSIYRLSPPRKFGWWFRTTADVDYLLNQSP
jgi:hypothetical protein